MKSPHSLLAGRGISSLQKKVSSSILLLLLLTGCTRPQVDPMPGSDPNPPGNDSELVYFNLTASTDDYRKISLKWDAQKGNPTYHILRATDSLQAKYDEIGSTKEATFIDAKVEFDKLYYYKIQAQYSSTYVVTSNDITIGRIQQPTDYNLAYEAYTNLAVATGGKRYDITEAGVLPETIIRIINEQVKGDKADIVFLIDNTGSMVDEINAVKKGLDKIISALPPSTRLGAGGYRDHEDLYQLRFQDLTTDFSVVRDFINKMTANGGGDKPEDIYDALYGTVTQATWVNKKRIVILIGDSSPHEGNLTQHSYTEVINKYQQAGVEVNINPILIKEE